MTRDAQLRFWLIALVLFVLTLFVLREVLLPFVAGMAIAYLLDPMADRLTALKLPRWLAATLVLLFFVVAFVLAVLLVWPLIQSQFLQLVEAMPRYVDSLRSQLDILLARVVQELSPEDVGRLRDAAGQYAGNLVTWAGGLARGLVTGGVAIFDVLSLLFITPVVAFYLLRDWDDIVEAVNHWLPREHADTIRSEIRQVDRTLAGWVRGQGLVCLILGVFYAVALSIVGLEFGFVVGMAAGLLSFIPYVGSIIGFVASVGIALVQFDSYIWVGVVAAIFVVGQAIEGNFLAPRLVGSRVGLHPVWVIFALLAGGSLFGFVGILLAVPVAAVIGVGIRFALRQYLASRYYQGTGTTVSTADLDLP